jgi:hypothetical protein
MKKIIFTKISALVLVLFGALFFFGCSGGGGDDSGPGGPQLPTELKGQLQDMGLGSNFPVPSGGSYSSWEEDEDEADQINIYWSGTTQALFDAYKDALDSFFGVTGTQNDDAQENLLGWCWDTEGGERVAGIFYAADGTLMLYVFPGPELPAGLDTNLKKIGIGNNNFPLPAGLTLAGWERDEHKEQTGSYQFNIYWTGASQAIFNTYKANLDIAFDKTGTSDDPENWVSGWAWKEIDDEPAGLHSAGLYFIKGINDEFPLYTLQLCLDAGNPETLLTAFGLTGCPLPSGVNFFHVDDDEEDELILFWADADETKFTAYKNALQTYFSNKAPVADDEDGIKGWTWEPSAELTSKDLAAASLQYLETDVSAEDGNLVAGTLVLYLVKPEGP